MMLNYLLMAVQETEGRTTVHGGVMMDKARVISLIAAIWASTVAVFGQTSVDNFMNPRSAGFLQLVDGAGTVNFVRGYYAGAGDYEERAAITAAGQTAILASSVDEQIDAYTIITHSIQIIGNHSLKLMCSDDNGVNWYNFCDPAIGGKLSPAYNNGAGATGMFQGPYNGPVSIDFRSVVGGRTHLALRWMVTGGTTVSSGDRVALLNEMDNWQSLLNPVNKVHVRFDNSTAIVSVDDNEAGDNPPTVPSYDVRGNIIGIYRSTDGGTTYQYQGDTNGYFYQQDIPNGQPAIYGAQRRDIYGNKSAQINATSGQATCDGRPGETRIVGANAGGTNVVLRWFVRNGTEVPCGTATSPLGWYEIYEGDMGQPLSTFSLVGVAASTDTGWTGPMPSGNKCYIVLAVAADGTTKEQDMLP